MEAGRHWQSPPGLPKRLAAAALLIAATSASAAATSTEPLSPADSKCVTPKGTPMVTVRRRPEEPGLRVDSCRFMEAAGCLSVSCKDCTIWECHQAPCSDACFAADDYDCPFLMVHGIALEMTQSLQTDVGMLTFLLT